MSESEKDEILKQTVVDEVVEEEDKSQASLSEKLKEQKKQASKKRTKQISILSGLGLFGLLVWYLFAPFKATAEYGICRSFLELQIPYPHTIYVSEIKPMRDGALKLWYTHTDAFGEYRMESFECKLVNDAETGEVKLSSLKMHKVYLDNQTVKALNNALPYFKENPLILTWPAALPDSLNDLHFDFDSVRKIIIDPKKN